VNDWIGCVGRAHKSPDGPLHEFADFRVDSIFGEEEYACGRDIGWVLQRSMRAGRRGSGGKFRWQDCAGQNAVGETIDHAHPARA
jgi:hypothetical protein